MTETITVPAIDTHSKHYMESFAIAVVLTTFSYLVALAVGWVDSVNMLEFFAVFTSYACTWLCVRQRRFNYVLGAISSVAFAVLFYQADLLASSMLNFYLAPTLVYGWFRWNHDTATRPVTHVRLKTLPIYVAVTLALYVGALSLVKFFDGQLATLDSLILIGTILAQFLLDNKKLENWYVWAAVNVVAIYVYITSGLYLVAFQYVFFLANTALGFYQWRKTMEEV